MQKNAKERKNPFLRKIFIVAFLPIITFVWITGWILSQIGDQRRTVEMRQKTLLTRQQFVKEPEALKKDSGTDIEPQIIT